MIAHDAKTKIASYTVIVIVFVCIYASKLTVYLVCISIYVA